MWFNNAYANGKMNSKGCRDKNDYSILYIPSTKVMCKKTNLFRNFRKKEEKKRNKKKKLLYQQNEVFIIAPILELL